MFAATAASQDIVFPFRIGVEPMECLLVAGLDGDPEFAALEPQRFDDLVNGKGLRVLRYRRDGRVDVYWEPGVRVDRSEISIGAGVADFAEVTMAPARFEISDTAVRVDLAFVDRQGREVVLAIAEAEAPCRRFPFLAPVGKDVQHPLRLFLVQMLGFDFVRRAGTAFTARIGDRRLTPARFPIPRAGRGVYFTRYAARPVIASLNPPMAVPLVFGRVPGGVVAKVDGMTLAFDAGGAVERASAGAAPHDAALEFRPAFPNLLDLADGEATRGRWGLDIAGARITGGTYALSRAGEDIAAELDVTEPWRPSGLPPSFRAFTALVRSFRTWPATYAWSGTVRLGSSPTLSGAWRRKNTGRP